MNKIKIHGIGNQKEFNYYIFDKKQKVAEKIADIIKQIFELTWRFEESYERGKGNWVTKKINIEKNKDIHESIFGRGEEERLDIFYGDKKMFITIYCSQKKRLKFNEELFKIGNFPKIKRRQTKK